MNKFAVFGILIGIVVAVSIIALFNSHEPSEPQSVPVYDSGFTYYDIETIQTTLAEQNIVVSAPIAITDHTTSEYCTFFENGLSKTVEYCITTAVFDFAGEPLGNINLGGNTHSPVMAVANLETLSLDSNQEAVFAVFETVVKSLVCDCWENQSDDFESISAWFEAVQTFYQDSGKRNVKSKIDNLEDYQILLEITSKEDSILQTLIILK